MTAPHPYSALTPDVVLDAVESLNMLCDGRILALNSYENRVYQVGIEDKTPIIAKFYRPDRWSDAQILEEHSFTQELADAELPVVPPMTNESGDTLFTFKNFRFSLFERRGGHAPDLDSETNLEVMGRFLGRMHSVGKLRRFEDRPGISIASYAEDNIRFLIENDFIPFELLASYRSLTEDLLTHLQRAYTQQHHTFRLHGDCHPGNILWRNEVPNFVDFDDARNGPAVQDLWMLLSGPQEQQRHQFDKVLTGYCRFCDFDHSEISLIEPLRTLRMINYSGWLAQRWEDPAFPHNFPWFNTTRYWSEHILSLREQLAVLQEVDSFGNC